MTDLVDQIDSGVQKLEGGRSREPYAVDYDLFSPREEVDSSDVEECPGRSLVINDNHDLMKTTERTRKLKWVVR